VGIALSVVLGMVLGASALFPVGFLLIVAALCLLFAVVLFHTKSVRWIVFSCVVLISATRFAEYSTPLSVREMDRLVPQLPMRNVELTGKIAAAPSHYARSGSGTWVFPMKCEGMKTAAGWIRKRGCIQIRVSADSNFKIQQGERWIFSGRLDKRDYPGNESVVLDVQSPENSTRLQNSARFSVGSAAQKLRKHGAETLAKGLETHPKQLAVYQALLLGYRKAVPYEIYRNFTQTGTVHIFAISGLHVGMVGLFIVIVIKSLGVPSHKWAFGLLPLLLLYVCSTGMKSSALRAWTMAAIYFLAPVFRRRPDIPSAVAMAAILLLWFQPTEILSAGFIYSFTVVSFLVMVFSALPPHWISGQREGWRRTARIYLLTLVITSAAAFAASLPLTALFFGNFSPVSLFGNLIVVPLTFCIVLSGWLAMVLPVVAPIFNAAALFFVNGLLYSVDKLAHLPNAFLQVAAPSLLAVLFWYGGWVVFWVHAQNPVQRVRALGWVVLAVIWTLILQWA